MPSRADRPAGIVDIRAAGRDRHLLALDRRAALAEHAPDERLVVVDDVDALVGHHEWYVQLAIAVQRVVCVAVGSIERPTGYELHQSAAVMPPWVTLWVGDERGVRWAAGTDRGSDVEQAGPGLPELLAVLTSPAVFDQVVTVGSTIRYRTASPALETVAPSLGPGELQAVHLGSLRALTGPVVVQSAEPLELPGTLFTAGGRDGGRPGASGTPADRVMRERAGRSVEHAMALVDAQSRPTGLGRSLSSTAVLSALAAAGDALSTHHEHAESLLTRMQQRLDGRPRPPAEPRHELPEPVSVDDRALVVGLHAATAQALAAGRTLSDVAAALRASSRAFGADAVAPARDALAGVGAPGIATRLSMPPPAEVDGGTLAVATAASFLTTALVTALPLLGVGAGVALLLFWIGLIVAVTTRAPGVQGVVPVIVVGAGSAVGLVAALLVRVPALAGTPVAAEIVIDLLAAAVALGVAIWAWDRLMTLWAVAIPLGEAAVAVTRISTILDDVLAGPYRESAARARAQDAAALLAVGLADVDVLFRSWADRLERDRPRDHATAVGAQVAAVVRADLAAIAVSGLAPYLDDLGAGAPLQVSATAVAERLDVLTADYDSYVRRGSIQARPPADTDPQARVKLAAGLWQHSGDARKLLVGDERIPMTQFCWRHELRSLDPDWRQIRVLKFAPAAAQQVLLGSVSDGVITTIVDSAGLLRLVPMRRGVVHFDQPTVRADRAEGPAS